MYENQTAIKYDFKKLTNYQIIEIIESKIVSAQFEKLCEFIFILA